MGNGFGWEKRRGEKKREERKRKEKRPLMMCLWFKGGWSGGSGRERNG